MRLDQVMHSVDGQALASTYVAQILRFFNDPSFFYSNNCSGSVLSKNWRLRTQLAGACKHWMRLAASCIQIVTTWPVVACKLYPCGRQSHATWIKSTEICLRLAATRVQFACNWRPRGYNLYATGRQSHSIFSCDWRPLGYNLFATGRRTHSISLPSGSQSHTFTQT